MGVRLMGALFVIFATTSYGFQRAKGYRERIYQLRSFQDGLSMLQTEITYGLTPLPLALEKVSRSIKGEIGIFFKDVSEKLITGDGELLEEYWNQCLGQLNTFLTKEDQGIIKNLGYSIGRSSVSEQKKHLEMTLRQLQISERESRELCSKNEKMWKYLGLFSGIALVLVLI